MYIYIEREGYLSLSLSLYIYIYRERERDSGWPLRRRRPRAGWSGWRRRRSPRAEHNII